MRSTIFALLGITTAAGLGLVAIFSQQGWPLLPPSPLPAPPGPVAVHDATVVGGPSGAVAGGARREPGPRVTPVATSPGATPPSGQDGDNSEVVGQVPVRQVSPLEPDGSGPAAPPAQQPPSSTAPPAVAPPPSSEQVPAPAPITPPTPPVVSSPEPPGDLPDKPGNGQGHGYGHFKSNCPEGHGDEDEPSPVPSGADLVVPEPLPAEPETPAESAEPEAPEESAEPAI